MSSAQRLVSLIHASAVSLAFAVLLIPTADADTEQAPGKRTVAQHMIDKSATVQIRNSYFDGIADKAKHRINVTTVNGVTLLIGEVPDAEAKDRLHHIAENTEGVRQVVNEIFVDDVSTPISLARDQWIRTKVKFKFGRSKEIPSSDIVAVVSNKVVYLMGVVSQEEADLAAQIARKVKRVERVVSIFEFDTE